MPLGCCAKTEGFTSLKFGTLDVSLGCVLHGSSCSRTVELPGCKGKRLLRFLACCHLLLGADLYEANSIAAGMSMLGSGVSLACFI